MEGGGGGGGGGGEREREKLSNPLINLNKALYK